MTNYYVVYKGRSPGIYLTWSECQSQITKFSEAIYKKFNNQQQAKYFLKYGKETPKSIPKNNKEINIDINSRKKFNTPEKEQILNTLYIYTDGSCINNGKKNARGGIGVHYSDPSIKDISIKFEGQSTNNKMELLAIYIGIINIININQRYQHIIIYTDSNYSINCLTKFVKGWIKNNWLTSTREPVKNKELVEKIYLILQKYKHITFQHINSHTGKNDIHSKGNARADELAVMAANSRKKNYTN